MENPEENEPQTNPSKIEVFQLTQKHLARIGIAAYSANQSHRFNWKILLGFLTISSYMVFEVIFAFTNAQTFTDYTQSAYVCILSFYELFCFLILVLKMNDLFAFFAICEVVVNTSEYRNCVTKTICHSKMQSTEFN